MKDTKTTSKFNQISSVTNAIYHLIFMVVTICCLYPVLLVIGISLTDEDCLKTFGYSVIPKVVSFESYTYVLRNAATILKAYKVTIFVTIVGTMLSVAGTALYAYAISRKEFRYRKFFTFFKFFTMLFSGGLVPWYLVCTRLLRINDTIWALILPPLISAWNVIIMKTFFATTVPDSIVESARIDGASEFTTFIRIVCPISLPGLATIGLFVTLSYWNDYWTPLMLTSKPNLANIQLYLYNILKNIQMLQDTTNVISQQASGEAIKRLPQEGARMAICVLAIGPIIFAYPFFQKYFIQGLTIGAVKG